MTKHNQQVGKWGENIAAEWLIQHGYEIIAQKENGVIFVEVKTLTSSKHFFPEHQITARKREHMLNAAQYYATENKIDHWQVDVISVEGKQASNAKITHFENAI